MALCGDAGAAEGPFEPVTRPGAGAPLENYANNFSPPAADIRSDLRKLRYSARSLLWQESALERVRKCGRVAVTEGGNVGLRLRDGVAGFAGLSTCSSVWADPVCNAKIMARRALEIGAAVESWQALGGSVGFVTLTMRHRKGQRLGVLWDGLSKAWQRVIGGAPWTRNKARFGVAGWLRVVEVTYGENGWHVHIHSLIFFMPSLHTPDLAGLHEAMFGRWSNALASLELGKPLMVGQDARLLSGGADADLARYFTKAVHGGHRIGLEFTASQTKAVRKAHGTAPVWSLLDAVTAGDADALDRWHEWERASKGRRQLTWARGLRDLLGLGVEATDEDIAEEELGTKDDELVLITAEGWRQVVAEQRMVALLELAEKTGLAGVRSYLDLNRIGYTLIGEKAAA